MRRITIFGGVALLALLLCCKDEVVVVVPVATVEISGPNTVLAGSTAQFSAIPKDDRGNTLNNRSIAWSTSGGSFATVSSNGTVTGVLGGQVTVSASCEGVSGSSSLQVNNPVPTVEETDPSVVPAQGGDFQLTVRGSGFVSTSVIRWNGVDQQTALVSADELRASISGGDFGSPGESVQISVHNSLPGGGTSGIQPLVVGYPVPTISALNPNSMTMISVDPSEPPPVGVGFNLTGTGFYPESTVQWEGEDRPAISFEADQLRVMLSWQDIAAPGWKTVTVTNPAPGGGASEAESIAVRIPFVGPFLAAGDFHTCALGTAGQAYCWGRNGEGQLGDGSRDDSAEPQSILPPSVPPSLSAGSGGVALVALTAGEAHSCALNEVGQAYCWGDGGRGQLGDGSWLDGSGPVPVSGGLHFLSLQAGDYHTCGLTYDGQAHCWGENGHGQLGDGSGASQGDPVPVQQGSIVFEALGAGGDHTCGVTGTGSVYCWGDNSQGQLGDGTQAQRNLPTAVLGLSGASGIKAGSKHTCAWSESGAGYCWGSNGQGQLGDGGTTSSSNVPVPVSGGLDFTLIETGMFHNCGTTTSGDVFCWGYNLYGQLGTGGGYSRVPLPVYGISAASEVAVGDDHSCALTAAGDVYCWGQEGYGQLGNGQVSYRSSPVPVNGGPPSFGTISAGGYHACGLGPTGTAYCWGRNDAAQLGNGSFTDAPSPIAVSTGTAFRALTSGFAHTCGLTIGGEAYCWGWNSLGQLGTGFYSKGEQTPSPVAGGHLFLNLRAGSNHTCGVTTDGQPLCWGWNHDGQLGNGSTQNAAQPTFVTTQGGQSFTFVGAGQRHSCGRTTTGEVWCWGGNQYGQLGDGSFDDRLAPVKLSGLPAGITWVSVGSLHTCALDEGGNAMCWGIGSHGELGTGTFQTQSTPQDVSGSYAFRSIHANRYFTCAITPLNQGYCWGDGYHGQLGTGELYRAESEPAAIAGNLSWATISDGSTEGYSTCGVTISGGGHCWGWQTFGELGIGTSGIQPLPVQIGGSTDFGQPVLPVSGRR